MHKPWIVVAYGKDGNRETHSKRFWTPYAAEEHALDVMQDRPDDFSEVHIVSIYKTLLDERDQLPDPFERQPEYTRRDTNGNGQIGEHQQLPQLEDNSTE